MTTDLSLLPQWEGRPVPWVTRWTKEIHPDRHKYVLQINREGKPEVHYPDRNEDRTDNVLWQREGIRRGGRPDWASVSTYRQRLSMRKRKCQMCGQKIDERPIRWLMPLDGIEYVDPDTPITMQPPTCSGCIPHALELCPNLQRRGWQILKVVDYKIWGVFGEVVITTEKHGLRRVSTAISYDTSEYGPHFSLGQVMAQQQVVQLGKFVVEEIHDPKGEQRDESA